MDSNSVRLERLQRVLQIQGEEILWSARALSDNTILALDQLEQAEGRIITSGVGKSGDVARMATAMFNSIGRPSAFLPPLEAAHGDLGMVGPGDVLLFISRSGETREVWELAGRLERAYYPIVSIVGSVESRLARRSKHVIPALVSREAYGLADLPLCFSGVALAICHALVVNLALVSGFGEKEYRNLHPAGGGKLEV